MSDEEGFKAPPIKGYQDVSPEMQAAVNLCKEMEERCLRIIDHLPGALGSTTGHDPRWLAIGRTHIQEGFMAINRSIFQPKRIALPSDPDQDPFKGIA